MALPPCREALRLWRPRLRRAVLMYIIPIDFIVARLNLLPAGSYARVKVFDERVIYSGFDSRQTTIEVAQIPAPL
jgi:hypothetical protein